MKKLYKYYSSSFDINSYLNSPTIRLSQLHTLNDPFEGMLPDILMEKLIPILQKRWYPEEPDSKTNYRYTKIQIRNFINEFGIASVSETHRNLLMWSHYASEHKGFCIGYSPDMLDIKNTTYKEIMGGYNAIELKKINYDTVPFDSEIIDEIVNQDFSEDSAIDILWERSLTTKSDAWSYEKEHRYISNINLCDQIIITRRKKDLASYMVAAIEAAQSTGTYEVVFDEKKVILNSKKTIPQIKTNLYEENCQVISALSPSKDVLFLLNIDKKDIKSIYLGARHEISKIDDLMDTIQLDPDLHHIKIYQYAESKNRYELTDKKIYPVNPMKFYD